MSDKQKIAFLCHPYHRGGVTRWMADAAIAFSHRGMDVYFLTVAPVKEFFSARGRETLLQLLTREDNAVHTITSKAGNEFEFGTAEYRAYVYRQLLVQLPAGTPVILSDDAAVWSAAAALYQSYPIIGVLHADEAQYYNLAAKYYRQAAALVCVSNRVHKAAQELLTGYDATRIYTIPCGINLPAVNDTTPSGNGILQLVYVGRVSDYQKRSGDLVPICTLLVKNNVQFHLHIIGDGEAKPVLETAFAEKELKERVTFYGWLSQNEVARHLQQSGVLVLTSDFEGMPIAMMEALAAGCGVAGTRVSGIEDYELHPLAPDCLTVFTPGDIEDAVSKINKVAAVPAGIRQQAARKLAGAEFSMQVCLEKYRQVIAAIKIQPTPPPAVNLPPHKLLYSKLLSVVRSVRVGR